MLKLEVGVALINRHLLTGMINKVFELILCDLDPESVSGVDHEDNGLGLLVVLLPERPVFALPGHVKHSEVYFTLAKCFHFETYSGCYFNFCILQVFIKD
jgi:hypothetical protein